MTRSHTPLWIVLALSFATHPPIYLMPYPQHGHRHGVIYEDAVARAVVPEGPAGSAGGLAVAD